MPGCAETQLIPTRYGDVAVDPGSEDLIVKFLHRYGEWAELEVEFLAAYLPQGARVLDIGGYLGTFSMGLARAARLDFIGIVEGNAAVLPLLLRNAQACLSCPHEIVAALVVDPAGEPIHEGWASVGNAGSSSFAAPLADGVRITPVDLRVTVDELLKCFAPLNLVKMDVEGMEGQLLQSCPELVRNESTLLWVECNESAAALDMAEQLLASGRPLTYFAWPSHNPENFNGAREAEFPFAHEAGLLLGVEPLPLSATQRQADCILRRITTLEDLRDALWCTPRWAPDGWLQLGRAELAAMAGHMLLGGRREAFLGEGEGSAIASNQMASSTRAPPPEVPRQDSSKWTRLVTQQRTQIFQLKQTLFRQVESERRCIQERAADERAQKLGLSQIIRAFESAVSTGGAHAQLPPLGDAQENQIGQNFKEQLDIASNRLTEIARAQASVQTALREELAQAVQKENEARAELQRIQISTTWRAALRLSKFASRVPLLKRLVKALLRKKQAWAR